MFNGGLDGGEATFGSDCGGGRGHVAVGVLGLLETLTIILTYILLGFICSKLLILNRFSVKIEG